MRDSIRNWSHKEPKLCYWHGPLDVTFSANPNSALLVPLDVNVSLYLQHNTFQVVLATDGEKSFVFFIYYDIQWGSGGVGFSAGDGVRSFTDSLASEALDHGSNVDIPGVYAYRVDLPTIISPGGQSDACQSHKVLLLAWAS